ncbi:hypothetical protein ACFLTE_04875, partial [Bacteroidota bacterium]
TSCDIIVHVPKLKIAYLGRKISEIKTNRIKGSIIKISLLIIFIFWLCILPIINPNIVNRIAVIGNGIVVKLRSSVSGRYNIAAKSINIILIPNRIFKSFPRNTPAIMNTIEIVIATIDSSEDK